MKNHNSSTIDNLPHQGKQKDKKETFLQRNWDTLFIPAWFAAGVGLIAGLNHIGPSDQAIREYDLTHPEFDRSKPALIVGHTVVKAHDETRAIDLNPMILDSVHVPNEYYLKFKQITPVKIRGKEVQAIAIEKDQVPKAEFDEFHDGQKVVPNDLIAQK